MNLIRHIDFTKVLGSLAGLAGVLFAVGAVGQTIGLDGFERMTTRTTPKIERGKQLFESQDCASCHGSKGGELEATDKTNLAESKFQYGGGLVQIYNFLTRGVSESEHKTYYKLPYQDRWALAHYVQSLGPKNIDDPPKVIEKAKKIAVQGTCDPDVKKKVKSRAEPQGQKQLDKGKELFQTNCASCHGSKGKGRIPGARNFQDPNANYVNGSSPFAIFNTLTNGINRAETSAAMPAFKQLSKDERWALVHWVRQWIPKSNREAATDEEIVDVCRTMSAPPKPESIPVDRAMKAMTSDYNRTEQRQLQIASYPPMKLAPDSSEERGKKLYRNKCSSCHGRRGKGRTLGPYGAQQPFLYNPVSRLTPAMAGGTPSQFAERVVGGVHATLPDMSNAATLTEQEWKDLQRYLSTFETSDYRETFGEDN